MTVAGMDCFLLIVTLVIHGLLILARAKNTAALGTPRLSDEPAVFNAHCIVARTLSIALVTFRRYHVSLRLPHNPRTRISRQTGLR